MAKFEFCPTKVLCCAGAIKSSATATTATAATFALALSLLLATTLMPSLAQAQNSTTPSAIDSLTGSAADSFNFKEQPSTPRGPASIAKDANKKRSTGEDLADHMTEAGYAIDCARGQCATRAPSPKNLSEQILQHAQKSAGE